MPLTVQDSHFEAVVIGGGPAGSAAAFTLASQGVRTCVIDRSDFPRDKLCGGFLTLRSKKIFERVFLTKWDEVIDATFNGISVFYRGAVVAEVRDYSTLFATQRYHFDNFLLRLAEGVGASLRIDLAAKKIDFQTKSIVLSDGSTVTFEHLVGADGVKSVVARSLFGHSFDPNTIGFGLELNVPRSELQNFPAVPEVHLGAARWGYGWVFPKRDHAVIGIGGLHRKNLDLKEHFRCFLIQRCGGFPGGLIKGHFLPYGVFRNIPGTSNVLLVGDAAGLVDSLSGEGIAFAMQSGNAAALSIIDHRFRDKGLSALDHYRARYNKITRIIKLSNRYRPFVFLPIFEKLFAKTLEGADAIQRGYLDIFADEMEYGRLAGLIGRQTFEGLVRLTKPSPRNCAGRLQ